MCWCLHTGLGIHGDHEVRREVGRETGQLHGKVILEPEIRVRSQNVDAVLSSWLGNWSLSLVLTSVTLCCYHGDD